MHGREQIRNAVVTAVTGLVTTGARVHENRVRPLSLAAGPALCVYTRSDRPDYAAGQMGNRPQRELEVHVEGYAEGDDQATCDTMAEEVETALFANGALLALVGALWLGEQTVRVDGEGADTTTVIDMVFNVTYGTTEGVPGTVLKA